jgi:hypothetical protein
VNPPEAASGRSSRLVARIRTAVTAREADGRPAPLAEAAFLLLVVLLFLWLHAAIGNNVTAATANALTLQSLERTLHLNIALWANNWLTAHPALIQPAVYYYRVYYVVIIGVLVWAYIRHAGVYVKVRRTLVAMTLLVLPIYWMVPMSPPRFALPGVVDIVAEHDIIGRHATRGPGSGDNVLSAMPSMHVGWSLWCAYAVWYALRDTHPRLALLSWIFPLGMAAVVLVTGNHYVLDIAASIALLIVSIAATSAWGHLARRRRTASE